jgi:tetrahydromethanopterin S-methyltransferase subunit G
MNLQYISDSDGKTTGVFIPIAEWNALKEQYDDIEEANIPDWQIKEVQKRMDDYQKNPDQVIDFDTALDDVEKHL